MKIGVLAVQGAVREHLQALSNLGIQGRKVRTAAELSGLSGLVLPGGESTAISLLSRGELLTNLIRLADDGFPFLGTCAGLILLAREIEGQDRTYVGAIDITVARNAFGRQVDSFETEMDVDEIGEGIPAVFIRAPYITRCGPNVVPLASYNGSVVAARNENVLVVSFHPELTDDLRIHRFFVDMVEDTT